jgi:dTDP-glucose 4,6-dehydratase
MLNILSFAHEEKVDKFVHLSTDEVYGQYYDVPHREWAKIVPSNPYSASKACQEAIAISYWRTYHIPLAIINCQNMFGKMQNVEKFIPKVIKYIEEGKEIPIYSSNGKSGARKYIHVYNLCSAIDFVMNMWVTKYTGADTEELPDRYHVGVHDEISNIDLVEKIAGLMGKDYSIKLVDELVIRPGYDKRYALNDSKLKSLGWKPPLNFEDSLLDVIKWTLDNKEWLQ